MLNSFFLRMRIIFSQAWRSLTSSIYSRRKSDRSRPDHPERISPNESLRTTATSVKVVETVPRKTSLTQLPILDSVHDNPSTIQTTEEHNELSNIPPEPASITDTNTSFKKCSDFYWACRNNDIRTVEQALETLTQDEIDQLEPNGSTALHAASYHGHTDVIYLLLKKGADRSIRNKFGYLPFDEAENDQIRDLFHRIPNRNRLNLDTGDVEWEFVGNDVLETALEERNYIKYVYDTTPSERMFEKIEKSYIEQGMAEMSKIDTIKHFFEKATRDQDPIWIIKAYTAETDFYNVLNVEIAAGASKYQTERRYIMALLSHHPKLNHLSYIGTSYRVMTITAFDLNKYQVNSFSKTKSFLSSSIAEKIAVGFLCRQEAEKEKLSTRQRSDKNGKLIKSWIMCKYRIQHHRTALHIENSSQYPEEGEVLIMPYTVFKIKSKGLHSITYLPDEPQIWFVEFEECDEYALKPSK